MENCRPQGQTLPHDTKFCGCRDKIVDIENNFQLILNPWIRLIHDTVNTLRLRQNGRHFPGNIFQCIFLNEDVWISIKLSLKFVPKGPINNIPALVLIMARHWPGDNPLSEPMMVRFLTCIYASFGFSEFNISVARSPYECSDFLKEHYHIWEVLKIAYFFMSHVASMFSIVAGSSDAASVRSVTGLILAEEILLYRKVSNIRRTKSQNWNDSHLVLKLSVPNPLKPGIKSRMKMWLEQRRQAMLQLHLSDQQFNWLQRCILY